MLFCCLIKLLFFICLETIKERKKTAHANSTFKRLELIKRLEQVRLFSSEGRELDPALEICKL